MIDKIKIKCLKSSGLAHITPLCKLVQRRPLLVSWEAEPKRNRIPPGLGGCACSGATWTTHVGTLFPKAEPQSSHSTDTPRSCPELCPQGWRPQQALSVGIFLQIPKKLVYPPQPGTQYVIIQARWAPTSVSSSMEKLVLVAPHAGYIFIQTDKTIYTPEHLGKTPGYLAWSSH